jgi:hypothetical protein
VAAVAVVVAVISYRHAYELVRSHGESGLTARLLPFTVDGLIWAASMLILTPAGATGPCRHRRGGAWGRHRRYRWGNLAHGLGHRPIGAPVGTIQWRRISERSVIASQTASTFGMISCFSRFMSSSVFETGTSWKGGQRSGIVSPTSR